MYSRNPLKRLFRSIRRVAKIRKNAAIEKVMVLSPKENIQRYRQSFRGYYMFCNSVPSYKRKGNK